MTTLTIFVVREELGSPLDVELPAGSPLPGLIPRLTALLSSLGECAMGDKIATLSMSDEQLRARREEILSKLGISLDELRVRAERYTLVGDEHEAWEELGSIAYLLNEGT